MDGRSVFRLGAERFAELTGGFVSLGVRLFGGCCGTTPEHITALRRTVDKFESARTVFVHDEGSVRLTSRSRLVRIGSGAPFCLIGERINPTGKKALSVELASGEFSLSMRYAEEQIEAGAALLDVNVGAPMVDEPQILPALVERLAGRFPTPLSVDTSNQKAMEAALKSYPASPLVNSINGEEGKMEFLGPLCRDFGAPFILLPLKGGDLPVSARERIGIMEELLEKMDKLKVPRVLALADCLVLSISSRVDAALECLKFIRYCAENLKLPTVAGLSNISFGLPARELLNAHFLSLAAGAGLSACIANPASRHIREAAAASDILLGKDKDAAAFISAYAGWSAGSASMPCVPPTGLGAQPPSSDGAAGGSLLSGRLEQAVITGLREDILPLVEEALKNGLSPFSIVNERLIPAITEVGLRFERKEYFLPQLLRSAETMQTAFTRLRPLLKKDEGEEAHSKIIMATVEGDIHDIGKNIVNLMLENHGFEVVDMGKDVKAADIVGAAVEHGAALIGLSALMTTTMSQMKDTLELLKERQIEHIKVMVGGAVVTPGFAESIGAHGFAKDAVEAVRVARRLTAR
jgi:5-methyltetrahydrofolate--homocysteine methyltransferase